MLDQFLKVGKIVGVRGLAGELKIASFCDAPQVFCDIENLYFDQNSLSLDIEYRKIFKNIVLMKIAKVDTIEIAKTLVGKFLYANKNDIYVPQGRFFIEDIIGLSVIDANTGENYGKICDIIQTGANDVYCIRNESSKEYLVPAIKEVINEIDIEKSSMFISPIKGIFDD